MRKKLILTVIILTTITTLTMGLFSFLKGNQTHSGKFVSEQAYKANREKQMSMTPQTLDQLRKLGITDVKELKLEYFFYTNTLDKSKIFADEIGKLNYKVEYGQSAGDKKLFIVTGWTTKMKMSDKVVGEWTSQMCDLGYKFDCDFDGWGTDPTQDDKK